MKNFLFLLSLLGTFALSAQSIAYQDIDSSPPATLRPVEKAPAAYVAPYFESGRSGLSAYLAEAVTYPAIARQNQLEGTVRISFRIATDGTVLQPRIESSAHPVLDKEALRVVRAMEGWQPARVGSEPLVRSARVDIRFRLP